MYTVAWSSLRLPSAAVLIGTAACAPSLPPAIRGAPGSLPPTPSSTSEPAEAEPAEPAHLSAEAACDASCRQQGRECLEGIDRQFSESLEADSRCWIQREGPCSCRTLETAACKDCLGGSTSGFLAAFKTLGASCKRTADECHATCAQLRSQPKESP